MSALRRLPTNVVDVFTADGAYMRTFPGNYGPVAVHATQAGRRRLVVAVDGDIRDHPMAVALVRRTLGVERDLTPFNRAAAHIPWLAPLAKRMVGVKPPRYPTLWEAVVNAVVFQQVSLAAASAIVRRLLLELSPPRECNGITLYQFPTVQRVLEAGGRLVRQAGLSANKWATLQRAAEALMTGTLDEAMLEGHSSRDAATLLQRVKGIGPWSATVILLRGLGRLDVFPMHDSSVARNLDLVGRGTPVDAAAALEALGEQRGMLYYHLLLARFESRAKPPSKDYRTHAVTATTTPARGRQETGH